MTLEALRTGLNMMLRHADPEPIPGPRNNNSKTPETDSRGSETGAESLETELRIHGSLDDRITKSAPQLCGHSQGGAVRFCMVARVCSRN